MSKARVSPRRSNGSIMLSGAATITIDLGVDFRLLDLTIDGLRSDQFALRSDAAKALRGLTFERATKKDRELLAG